jgi:hypothetical protein
MKLNQFPERNTVAEDTANPTPTSQPEEQLFTKMSEKELHALIEQEGRKFVEQTADGDIEPSDYLESEDFSLSRLMNLFFAFEYFERTETGNKSKNYDSKYLELYIEVYEKIKQYMGGDLYDPEYAMKL